MMKQGVLILCIVFSLWIASAATLHLFPDSWIFTKDCPFAVDILLDTENKPIQTAEIKLYTDWDYSLGFDSNGWLFPSYVPPQLGRIRNGDHAWEQGWYMLGSTMWWWYVQWSGKFATITIIPSSWQDDISLQFYVITGQMTDDSNVIYVPDSEHMNDVLTTAEWGIYTLEDGPCFIENPTSVPSQEDSLLPQALSEITLTNPENAMTAFDISDMRYAYYMKLGMYYLRSFVSWSMYVSYWWYFLFL